MTLNTIVDATGTLLDSADAACYVVGSVAADGIIGFALKMWLTGCFGVPGLAWSAAVTCFLLFVLLNQLFASRVSLLAFRHAPTIVPVQDQAQGTP